MIGKTSRNPENAARWLKPRCVRRFCQVMPYSRQRPRIAANGRIAVRLTTRQRDLFTHDADIPRPLSFALRQAPVRAGKLSVRITREGLDALIAVAAKAPANNRDEEKDLAVLVRYLEGLEDRFSEPEELEE